MAIPMRYAPRRAHFPYLWFLATAAAALIAVVPVVAAIVVTLGGGSVTRTAFASAPAGHYAVLVRPEADADVIFAVAADGSVADDEIARVPRLPGYTAYGAVSPDGRTLALVTADGGTQANPAASLVAVDLETGELSTLADSLDYLQTPVWSPDSASIVVTRSSGDGSTIDVDLVRVAADGSGEDVVAEANSVLGAYPIAFDQDARLVHIVIDGRGSTVYRAGEETLNIAAGITRDWQLSPDGTTLAFIETSTASGVEYFARTAALDGAGRTLSQFSATGQSLGTAWNPASGEPSFGHEPGTASEGSLPLTAAGFDVPIAYSPDGQAVAVQHWTGVSFAQAGETALQLVGPDGARTTLEAARFYGWATR